MMTAEHQKWLYNWTISSESDIIAQTLTNSTLRILSKELSKQIRPAKATEIPEVK